jgi:hypothetical protein
VTAKKIAQKIDAHLRRFERTPSINVCSKEHGTSEYYWAGASASGRWINIIYVGYQGSDSLTKDEALEYLKWLDAGNVGKHWEMRRRP